MLENTVLEKEITLQSSNIDEQGNVLYLDADRLERRRSGFTPYKNKPRGLGVSDFIKEHVVYVSYKRKRIVHKLYHFVIDKSKWIKQGGLKGEMYKKLSLVSNNNQHTSSLVMPLNVDITDKSQKVIVPMDMLKESLKNMTFIGGMDHCLCREANNCKDFPQDFGCLFLGEAGRFILKHGLGRELTYEEACAHIDRAAELGLMAQAAWLEIEHFFWSVTSDEGDKFLEVCFCCPCCCVGMRLMRNLTPNEYNRFHPSGWTAVADRTKCIGCKKCGAETNGCPVEAISFGKDGKVVIDQDRCLGCGICKSRCPADVIKIKQTMPMRKDLHEYFAEDCNMDLKLWKE